MAIINSLAIGKSVKSAGNLTYKTVRGRTIASQRITTNKSNTMAQSIQRSRFAVCARAAQLIQVFINNCYEKSKYGSARNAFMHINKNYDAFALISEVQEGAIPLVDAFIPAFLDRAPEDRETYIEWSAYGTSPVITRETVVSGSFTDTSSQVFQFRETSRVEYSLINPVSREKANIVLCGLIGTSADGLANATLTSRNFTLKDEDITTMGGLGFQIDVVEDSSGNIVSFAVSTKAPTQTGDYEAYAVIFPVVGGKIPKLKGWLHALIEPAP